METVYIGLGSNLQDPATQVKTAIDELATLSQTSLSKTSSLYRSSPMGPQDQPDYINAVAEIATALSPLELLQALQAIEDLHFRHRSAQRWSARTLDLDILLFGQNVITLPTLTIPHPGLYERAFVLYPLQEIAPDVLIPGHGELSRLIADCSPEGLTKL